MIKPLVETQAVETKSCKSTRNSLQSGGFDTPFATNAQGYSTTEVYET